MTSGAAPRSVSILLFLSAVLIAAKRIVVGLDLNDSPYFISLITHGDGQSGALFPGYVAIGSLWARLCGDSLIAFRLLFGLIVATNLAVTRRTILRAGSEGSRAWFLLSVTAVITTAASTFVFGYDVPTSLVLVLIVDGSVRWHQDHRLSGALALGVLSIVAAAVRIPNAVAVGPLLLLVGLTPRGLNPRQRALALIAYAAPFAGLFVAAGAAAAFGRGDTVSRAVRGALDGVGRASQAGYEPAALAAGYARDGIVVLCYALLLWLFHRAATKPGRLPPERRAGLVAAAAALLGVLALWSSLTFAWNFRLLVTACALCYAWLAVTISGRGVPKRLTAVLAALALVPAAGSDTGLLKTTYVSVYLIPVFIALLDGQRRRAEPADRSRAVLALSLIPASIILGACWSYGDVHNPFTQRHPIAVERLHGVRTTASRAAYVQSVYERTRILAGTRDVLVVGEPAHLFYYLFDARPFDGQRFMQTLDDEGLVDRIVAHARGGRGGTVVLYVPGSEYDQSWPEQLEAGAWKDAVYEAFVTRMSAAGFAARPFADHVAFVSNGTRVP